VSAAAAASGAAATSGASIRFLKIMWLVLLRVKIE
jgi:hypothetical protein